MSSPEQKAKELVDKIEGVLCGSLPMGGGSYLPETKACALICVEEIITEIDRVDGYEYDFSDEQGLSATKQDRLNFWQKVKEKINDLK